MHANTETTDRILNCAQSLMVERGYNAFSYADIAQVVHISKASIHHHFPTKSLLAKKVIVRYRENIRVMINNMKELVPDPFDQLKAYVNYWESCIRDNSTPFCICALLAAEIPTLPDEVSAEIRGHFHELAEWLAATIERGVQQGVLNLERPSAIEAEALMAIVHGAMLTARAYGGDWKVFASVTEVALHRLTPATTKK